MIKRNTPHTLPFLGAFLLAFLFIPPRPAQAYVDPGILGALSQVVYVFIFGALATWLLRPFRFVKRLFHPKGSDQQVPAQPPDEQTPASAPERAR